MSRSDASVDILIVGNGVLGLFLADELSRRTTGVIGIAGPADRRAGASQAAGAMLGCFGEVTKDTLATEVGRARFEVGYAAHKRWPAVLERLTDLASARGECLRHVPDTYIVLNSCGGELDSLNFRAIIAGMESYGEPYEETETSAIKSYQPRPGARALRVLHLPDEGAVDGRQVLSLMDELVTSIGVRRFAPVKSLITADGAIAGAWLTNGEAISAGTVVIAAGAATNLLLGTALDSTELLPMFAGSGVAFVGRRVFGDGFESVVRSPNRAGSCGLHLVPIGDKREYVGATNILFDDVEADPYVGLTRFLAECAMQEIDERICFHRILEWRVGNRPVTLDGFPVVGWSSLPGLYVLSGTYRDGFHCSPVLAEHVADQLLGGDGTFDLPFLPQRAPICTRTIEESVDEFTLHMEAGWFEARASAPPAMSTVALRNLFRSQAIMTYDILDTNFGLSPDVLMYLTGPDASRSRIIQLSRYLAALPSAPHGQPGPAEG